MYNREAPTSFLCASSHRVTHGIQPHKLFELLLKYCMLKMLFMSRKKHAVCSQSSQASCWDRSLQWASKANTWLRAAPSNCHKRLSSCS